MLIWKTMMLMQAIQVMSWIQHHSLSISPASRSAMMGNGWPLPMTICARIYSILTPYRWVIHILSILVDLTSFDKQHHCVLPSFHKPAQALNFDPSHPNVLVMVFPDNTLQFYDVEGRQFPSWGKELSSALPKRLTHAHEPVIGVTFDPTRHSSEKQTRHVLLWGSTWICKLSLSEDRISSKPNRKRRREHAKEPAASHDHEDYKMITHYRPILFLDFLANGELVVIERPLIDVLSTLPPPFFTPKYGAS